jgi:hypothetical protein
MQGASHLTNAQSASHLTEATRRGLHAGSNRRGLHATSFRSVLVPAEATNNGRLGVPSLTEIATRAHGDHRTDRLRCRSVT